MASVGVKCATFRSRGRCAIQTGPTVSTCVATCVHSRMSHAELPTCMSTGKHCMTFQKALSTTRGKKSINCDSGCQEATSLHTAVCKLDRDFSRRNLHSCALWCRKEQNGLVHTLETLFVLGTSPYYTVCHLAMCGVSSIGVSGTLNMACIVSHLNA